MDQVPAANACVGEGHQTTRRSACDMDPNTTDEGEFDKGREYSRNAAEDRTRRPEDYLFRRRVPGYSKPDCECGWPQQTPKHIILFCPTHTAGRAEMLAEAKTTDYTKLLSTEAGLRAVTRWLLQRDILTQFSLARTSDDAKPRRRGRRPGTYVDEDDGEC